MSSQLQALGPAPAASTRCSGGAKPRVAKLPITVVALTLDEERALSGCLESVAPYFSETVVLDSGSSDRTLEIAASYGARVAIRRFDDYASQRNFALADPNIKNDWVLFLDADERLTRACVEELRDAMESDDFNDKSMYCMRRKDYFRGKWLKRASGYPIWLGRLCKRGDVVVNREINEEYCASGEVGFLRSHIAHFPFLKGIQHWIARHNKYSTMEARLLFESDRRIRWKDVLGADRVKRRREIKALSYKLPARPALAFLFFYIVRLGFLDGYPGFSYCVLRSYYEFLIGEKLAEAKGAAPARRRDARAASNGLASSSAKESAF